MNRCALLILIFLFGCETAPQPINFGKDLCEHCKMTIIDKKFGAELVNAKGKAFKFDSGECMLSYLKAETGYIAEKFYVISYESPGELIDAEKAIYLHGGQVQSPMGGKLAAFSSKETAEKFQKELQGEIQLWREIRNLDF